MTYAVSTEDKHGLLFQDALGRASLEVGVLSAATNQYGNVLEVSVGVLNAADWQLRYAVQDVARQFEDEYHMTVVCFFRQVDGKGPV